MGINDYYWYMKKHEMLTNNNQEINIEEFINELDSGDYKLALENGLFEKIKTMSDAHFYKNDGAICLIQSDDDETIINHIENKNGKNGYGESLLRFVLIQNKDKLVRLTAQGGNQKLVDYYKQFGFEETGEECPYGVRMIKNSIIVSMASPWKKIKDKIENHVGVMLLHLAKIYFYHDFEDYLWGWADSVRKGFDNISKRADTKKLPTKEDIYNYIWKELLSEDCSKLLEGYVIDINEVYVDVPKIPITNIDYDGFNKFVENYIELLAESISERGNIAIKQILDFINNYDYGFSLKGI